MSIAIPDHELLSLIGRGAYGEVWLARNVMGVGRAVKIVRRDAFSDSRPYEREFAGIRRYEPLSRQAHGLVNVLHVGRNEEAGYFYYVMELADTQDPAADYAPRSLNAELKKGALPAADCTSIALSLATALDVLHRAGLVHRDIKPSNIIFVDGAAKLADIGLVVAQGESRSFVGTEGYIAPEGPGTPQGDVYALGVVLYEMLTGLDWREFPRLPPGLAGRDATAVELLDVIIRACEHSTSTRYRDAREMLADLALVSGGKSVRELRLLRRRLRLLRAAAVVLAALGIVAAGVTWWSRRVARHEAALAAEVRDALWSSRMERARSGAFDTEAGSRAKALAAAKEAARIRVTPELRSAAINTLLRPDIEFEKAYVSERNDPLFSDPNHGRCIEGPSGGPYRLRTLPHGGLLGTISDSKVNGGSWIAKFSLDGNRMLLYGTNGHFEIWELPALRRSWSAVEKPATEAFHRHAQFSADGRHVVWPESHDTLSFTALDGAESRTLKLPAAPVGSWMLSPDGRLIVVGDRDKHSIVIDSTTGVRVSEIVTDFPIYTDDWSPDSRWLLLAAEQGIVEIFDAEDGRSVARHRTSARGVGFAGSRAYFLSTGYDGRTHLSDTLTGLPVSISNTAGELISGNVSEGRFAMQTWGGTGAWLGTLRRSAAVSILATAYGAGPISFTPDGTGIVTADPRGVSLWKLPALRAAKTYPSRMTTAILWSPDGTTMHTSGYQPAAEFDAAWSAIKTVDFPKANVDSESWSRDARVKIIARQADGAKRGNAEIYRDGALVRTHEVAAEGLLVSSLQSDISPDGHWAAMAAFQGIGWHVWNTENGKEVASGPYSASLRFSPDNRWLMVSASGANELWDTRTWLLAMSWPRDAAGLFGRAAWTADSRTIAIQPTRRSIALLSAADWQEIATLQIPAQSNVVALEFAPGGHKLAAAIRTGFVQIFDLDQLRAELRELGIEW